MSVAKTETGESHTNPGPDCEPCQAELLDDELVLDTTGAEPTLEKPDSEPEDAEIEVEDVSDRQKSLAERGAELLGVESAELDGMAEMKQANGKRVVKVLASVGIGVVILNEVFSVGSLANSSGPFAGVIGTIETTGVAALTLIVVGLIAYAGAVAMGYLDMF